MGSQALASEQMHSEGKFETWTTNGEGIGNNHSCLCCPWAEVGGGHTGSQLSNLSSIYISSTHHLFIFIYVFIYLVCSARVRPRASHMLQVLYY